ncbi:hypothetical protein [Pantoea sp. A4]|uniref:hypothetical protein n=1 Tax=Pantoea sp. A4 TaxID=1225184 RepID=UPI00035F9F7D|nr:hypothetical protein [Pantoea sp. A4]
MNIEKKSLDRIRNINWFSSVGEPVHILDGLLISDPIMAAHELSQPSWEDTTLEASNSISSYISMKYPSIFQGWNNVAKEAKHFFDSEVSLNIPKLDGFDGELVIQCIGWDVVHYFIEDFYKDKISGGLFFNRLISIYETGHLPCGFDGEWPLGRVMIY